MIVTILLGDDRPPFRVLWEGPLETVPLPGEPIAFNDRIYRVEERSWRFGHAPGTEGGPAPVVLAVGLMVRQIGGAPHVAVSLNNAGMN